MGVYIKDMDKPSECDLCNFEDYGYCRALLSYIDVEEGIDTRCPLVEIADRKTENSSEKPNKSEIPTGSGEPQTDLVNDSQVLVKDLVDDEFNPYDEECMRCKHLKLKCEFIPTYCKFESRDEPQTERSR